MFVLGLSVEEGDGRMTCDEVCEHVTSLLTDWEESRRVSLSEIKNPFLKFK